MRNVPEFYRPERGDLILNPFDACCSTWSPWWELMPGSEAMDAEAVAAAMVSDPLNTFNQGGADFFFRHSARTLLVGLLAALKSQLGGHSAPARVAAPRFEAGASRNASGSTDRPRRTRAGCGDHRDRI
jgi:hypothetical protein